MNGFYGHKVISATIASNALVSDAIEVANFHHVAIELPSFACNLVTTTANVYCQVAKGSSDTFRRVQEMGVYSASSGIQDWEIPSSTGNRTVVCRPAARFDNIKIELANTATNGLLVNVHVHN